MLDDMKEACDMKKIFDILFVLLLRTLLLPAMASTENSGACGENMTWVLDDKEKLTIRGTGKDAKLCL